MKQNIERKEMKGYQEKLQNNEKTRTRNESLEKFNNPKFMASADNNIQVKIKEIV